MTPMKELQQISIKKIR